MNSRTSHSHHGYRAHLRSRSGFTLIEILVALAIFALMMAIIFVPLRLGINSFAAGNTRSQVQAAANQTAAKIEAELRTAVYVFPNDAMVGISDQEPYNHIARPANGVGINKKPKVTYALPYLRQIKPNTGACDAYNEEAIVPVANLGRIDFIPPKRDAGGNIIIPMRPADYIVTYYARRLDPTIPFDVSENPIVMFRAQTPFKHANGTPALLKTGSNPNGTPPDDFPLETLPYASGPTTAANFNIGASRYPDFSSGSNTVLCGNGKTAETNRGALWLVENDRREPDLEGLSKHNPDINTATTEVNKADTVIGSHTQLTPRGMEIVAPRAGLPQPDYTPTTTFTCEDTNHDGVIDRVTLRLFLASATNEGVAANGQPQIQSQGLPQIMDLPNVK